MLMRTQLLSPHQDLLALEIPRRTDSFTFHSKERVVVFSGDYGIRQHYFEDRNFDYGYKFRLSRASELDFTEIVLSESEDDGAGRSLYPDYHFDVNDRRAWAARRPSESFRSLLERNCVRFAGWMPAPLEKARTVAADVQDVYVWSNIDYCGDHNDAWWDIIVFDFKRNRRP